MIANLKAAIGLLVDDVNKSELTLEKKNAFLDELKRLNNTPDQNKVSAEIMKLTDRIKDAITANKLQPIISEMAPVLDAGRGSLVQTSAAKLGEGAAQAFTKRKIKRSGTKTNVAEIAEPAMYPDDASDNGVPGVFARSDKGDNKKVANKAPGRLFSLFCCCPVGARKDRAEDKLSLLRNAH